MRALVLASVIAVVGCHKGKEQAPGGPASTAEADALWKLAPDGAIAGIVASPRALAMFEHGWKDIHDFIAATPELAPVAQEMTAGITKLVGSPDLAFASLGLTTAKGGAVFITAKGESVVIVPLGDRDKFLAIAKGKKGDKVDTMDDGVCKTTQGVYACGKTEALLDRLGKGNVVDGLAAASARGDLEIVAHDLPFTPLPIKLAIVAQLERGGVTLRGTVGGLPKAIVARFGEPSKPRTDDHTTGFALAHVKPLLDASGFAKGGEAIDGITPAQFLDTLKDPITMTAQTDPAALDLRVSFSDVEPMKKLLGHCETVFAGVGAKLVNGTCQIPVPQMGTYGLWIEGNELRMGTKGVATGAKVAMSTLGTELANGDWQVAMWGRGSMFASLPPEVVQQLQTVPIPDMAKTLVRVMTTLGEVGLAIRADGDAVKFVFGARTLWSNPDDVVAKVLAIAPADLLAGKGAEVAKPIVAAAPQSPFAADVKAGYTGMMAPMAIIGVIAAVAVPAFMDYMKKSKESAAELQLHRISRRLEAYYAENATLPVGDEPPTPPGAGTCCDQPDHKCAVDAKAWANGKMWSKIGFQIDRPQAYRFTYHSDGKSALVESVGDLDCDGTFATYRLYVDTTGGQLHSHIAPPAPGTD